MPGDPLDRGPTPSQRYGLGQRVQQGRQWGLLAFAGVVVLLFVLVLGRVAVQQLFLPDTGVEILESAENPSAYRYESQMVRQVRLDATPLETHALRSYALNMGSDAFNGRLTNVFPEQMRLASDATTTIFHFPGEEWQQTTEHISAQAIAAPSPREIATMDPAVIDDQASFRSRRAWQIAFTPTPDLVGRLFQADAFEQTGEEWEAIQAGKFTTDFAYVMVVRDSRQMLMLDTRFTVASEYRPTYRFLILYSYFDDASLNDFRLS